MHSQTQLPITASSKEKLAWCLYDFANSGYTTVVLTTIFSAYFVSVIVGPEHNGTLLWTITLAIANGVVLLCAPILGAIADYSARKKRFLLISTVGCVLSTALLSLIEPGDIYVAMAMVIIATIMFSFSEVFISAFLPEIETPERMGRLSGYGWTIGYIGGLITLSLCLAYIEWAKPHSADPTTYIPNTNLIVAIIFALAATPTFIWLKERAKPLSAPLKQGYARAGYQHLRKTLFTAHQYTDLFRFLGVLVIYHSGINTVIVIAAVYAQQVMGFKIEETILLIIVVNISAALGAFLFGHIQDKIGSKKTLAITLFIWSTAIAAIAATQSISIFWLSANLIGIALGASQSAGRALIGQFSPPTHSGEFFGLWGMATRTAAILGPLSYGMINHLFSGDHRASIISTLIFFMLGLLFLTLINEKRGILYAKHNKNNASLIVED